MADTRSVIDESAWPSRAATTCTCVPAKIVACTWRRSCRRACGRTPSGSLPLCLLISAVMSEKTVSGWTGSPPGRSEHVVIHALPLGSGRQPVLGLALAVILEHLDRGRG